MAKAKYKYNEQRKEWYTLVYDGTLTPTGAKHRKRISSKKSSADLEKKILAFKMELAQKGSVSPTNITFQEYAQKWLSTNKATREYNTIRMYETTLNTCFEEINDVPLANLTHSHFQICINSKLDHPRTCQVLSLTFKQIIKSAVRDHILPRTALDDILMDISLPRYSKPQKRALYEVEKESIKTADFTDMERTFVYLLYYCGLRRGEALALTKKDFNWTAKTVSITKSWVSHNSKTSIKPYPKSEKGIRTIPLPDVAVSAIKDYIESTGDYVFTSKESLLTAHTYDTFWNRIIRKMNKAAGYDPTTDDEKPIPNLTAHVFRHNYCTELCYQVPLISTKKIAELLGDNEKMVLEVYSHIIEDKEQTQVAINNIFT